MVAITKLLFCVATVSAAVLPRDKASLQSDLNTIYSDTVALDNAVQAFSGDFNGGIAVQNAYSKVDNDVKTANTNAGKSTVLNDADSQSIIDYINNTLEPKVKSTVADLEAKKAQFAAISSTGTVHDDLSTLKSDVDSYGATLLTKCSSGKKSAGQAALSKIDADLQGGINYFAS